MRWYPVAFLSGVLLCAALLLTCHRASRQTYRVTEDQLHRMGEIAGIKPCAQGPTIIAAVKRHKQGGVVHVECPMAHREGR